MTRWMATKTSSRLLLVTEMGRCIFRRLSLSPLACRFVRLRAARFDWH